ncbi:hypothetical protein ACP4OV_018821 [Aristida adscensionis]
MASIFARRRFRETDRRRAKRARTHSHRQDPKLPDAPSVAAASPPPVLLDWRDWANLTAGPAGQIAELLLSGGAAEHVRLRAVCRAWRACHEDLFHPREWVMLPRAAGAVPDDDGRCFLDVRGGERIHVSLPLLRRRHALGLTAEGLLVLCRTATPHAVQLLDPLSRQLVDLPDAATLAAGPEGFRYRVTSAGVAGVAGDSTAVLRFGRSTLATARPGDERWTVIHLGDTIMSTMACAGRFYVATSVNILEVVTATCRPPELELAADYHQVDGGVSPDDLLRLVDDGGELLLAHRINGGGDASARRARTDARDWVGLPSGPAGLIAERVLAGDVADYARFRAACAAWRACCDDPRAHGVADRRFHPRHWILLPRGAAPDSDDGAAGDARRSLLNVCTGERVRVRLPLLRRCRAFGSGSTAEGLLVLCRKDAGGHAMHLLNPLTGHLADLPPATSGLLDQYRGGWARDNLFRSACLADDSTVALLCGADVLAVAKPGDEHWTLLRHGGPSRHRIMAALPFAGRLYCITHRNILVVEMATPASRQPQLAAVADHRLENNLYPMYRCTRWTTTVKLVAYRAKLDAGKLVLVPMRGLGGHTLFIGPGHSPSVSVCSEVSSSIRADTVYLCCSVDMVTRHGHRLGRPKVLAFDLLGGRCYPMPMFDKEDVAIFTVTCVQS